jgi:hypothetical protein
MDYPMTLIEYLTGLLQKNSEPKSLEWLKTQTDKIRAAGAPTQFYLAFSQASRFFKKEPLQLSEAEKSEAQSLVPGFEPAYWNSLQTARTVFLLSFPADKEKWLPAITQLFETGDMNEQQALYAALPLLPYPDDLLPRAIDGCRTNMTLVFDAIALDNPYPAQYFPEANWNQLVLKSIFMQCPLYRIQQLDERRNLALANIASDFAHERWAAGRPVMPEMWRLVVPFINDKFIADLKRVVKSEDQMEVEAGLLALYQCQSAEAKQLLQSRCEEVMAIEYGEITWEKIGVDFQEQKA